MFGRSNAIFREQLFFNLMPNEASLQTCKLQRHNAMVVGRCHLAWRDLADGGTASCAEGSCEYIE